MRHPQDEYILFSNYARFHVEQDSCICVACFRDYTRFSAKSGHDRALHVPCWVKLSSSELIIERHCFMCCKNHATQLSNDIGSLGVEGTVTNIGSLGVEGTATNIGSLGVEGTATNIGSLGVEGTATNIGSVGVEGTATNIGSLGVKGTATNIGSLGVEGTATNTGSLGVEGTATNIGSLGVEGTATNIGSLGVEGVARPNECCSCNEIDSWGSDQCILRKELIFGLIF